MDIQNKILPGTSAHFDPFPSDGIVLRYQNDQREIIPIRIRSRSVDAFSEDLLEYLIVNMHVITEIGKARKELKHFRWDLTLLKKNVLNYNEVITYLTNERKKGNITGVITINTPNSELESDEQIGVSK